MSYEEYYSHIKASVAKCINKSAQQKSKIIDADGYEKTTRNMFFTFTQQVRDSTRYKIITCLHVLKKSKIKHLKMAVHLALALLNTYIVFILFTTIQLSTMYTCRSQTKKPRKNKCLHCCSGIIIIILYTKIQENLVNITNPVIRLCHQY